MKAFNNGWNYEPEWKREREGALLQQEPAPATEALKAEGSLKTEEKKEEEPQEYVPTIEDEMKRTEAIIKYTEDAQEQAAKNAERAYRASPQYRMMKAFNSGWNYEPEWKRAREDSLLQQDPAPEAMALNAD